jgi:plastocyanin
MRMPTLLVMGAAAAALAVAGCGGGGGSNTSTSAASTPAAAASTPSTSASGGASAGGGESLKISADPTKIAFNTKTLSAKAGKVTITMANPSSIPHGVAIQGSGVNQSGSVVNKGGTSTVTVTLKPGKYTFYCPVPGHRQAGMEGTLTVP